MLGQILYSATFLVLGVLLGAAVTIYIQRPRLIMNGGGGGGGNEQVGGSINVTIANPPAVFGFKVGQTVIFGKPVMRERVIGLRHDRRPARKCVAWLYDDETKKAQTALYWRKPDGSTSIFTDIEPGDTATLMVLATAPGDPLHVFPYTPTSDTDSSSRVPAEAARAGLPLRATIRVSADDRTLCKVAITVEQDLLGRVNYEAKYKKTGVGGSLWGPGW